MSPAGLALRTEVEGERLTLDLLYDETWNTRIAQAAPIATLAESGGMSAAVATHPIIWKKSSPVVSTRRWI